MNYCLIKGFNQICREPKCWGEELASPTWKPPDQINPTGILSFLNIRWRSVLGFNFFTLKKPNGLNFFKLLMFNSFVHASQPRLVDLLKWTNDNIRFCIHSCNIVHHQVRFYYLNWFLTHTFAQVTIADQLILISDSFNPISGGIACQLISCGGGGGV